MPSNSVRIRITVWLPNVLYHEMHDITIETNESHADFVRAALRREVLSRKLASEKITRKIAKA